MEKFNLTFLLLITLAMTFISSYSFGQLNFTVNSLADDEHSYAWDNPDTPDFDESMDGICNDEDGRCTLGAAYGESFNMNTPVNIDFSVSGTINLMNAVSLFDGSTIDGGGQIELKSPYACMSVDNNTTVKGIKFSNATFGTGLIVGGKNNHIGGFNSGNEFVACNVGLTLGGDSNEVYSNYFGLDKNNVLMPNRFGMLITGSYNTIGKPVPGYSNKICGNYVAGIELGYGGHNEILFNYIGTTTDGLTGYGNLQGIVIAGSDENKIGSDSNSAGNIISGNQEHGIIISGAPPESYSSVNNITHNIIGLSPLQNAAVPNGSGIVITNGARYDIIQNNVIAGNNQNGILIFGIDDTISTEGHLIQDNKIGINDNSVIYPNLNGILIRGNTTSISIGADISNNNLLNRIIGNQQGGIVVIPDLGFSPKQTWFRKNIINQNIVTNLLVDPSANLGIQPPTNLSINGVTLAGIHQFANVVIDIYEANRFEGPPSAYQWLGSTTTNASGVFAFDITDPLVEAVSVTASTSSMGTSSFAYFGIVTGIEDENEIPKEFSLAQNYPNPFNPSTKISWQLPVSSHVSLTIYDVLGYEVKTLVDEYKPAGNYEVEFNASSLASGIYFYKIQAGSFVETKKMILLR